MNLEHFNRRRAIKTLAVFAASSIFPERWGATVSAAVGTPTTGEVGYVRLNLADFAPLAKTGGSVRIGTSRVAGFYPTGIFFPIIVTRASASLFYAVSAECTHASCTLPKYSGNYMECACHGSRYTMDGQVIRGPASFPLRQFNAEFDGGSSLKIEVPDIGFTVVTERVQNADQGRLKIDFLGFESMTYELRFRPAVTAPWTTVPFALSSDGALDQTSIPGVGDYSSVYVDIGRGNGFYAVFLQVRQV